MPSMPKLSPTPAAPTDDSAAVRQRELQELKLQEQRQGTAGTMKAGQDLVPGDLVGQRRVLLGV
jgi:hypothetical protein